MYPVKKGLATVLAALMMVLHLTVWTSAAEPSVVRVGFFPMPGFHEYDNAGHPCGYDVDYLNRLSIYTGLQFEYIRADTWDAALDMLENGEVDIVGSAQMDQERAARFDYSEYSAGSTFGVLLALAGNDDLVYEDFQAFDNIKIGCVSRYIRREEFMQYTQEKGFSPDITFFSDTESMRKSLQAGEIDAMACSVTELSGKEKMIGRFAPAPFYYIVQKGDYDLLQTIDYGMSQIKMEEPLLEQELFDRYYANSRIAPFTRSELDYAASCPPLRIGYMVNRPPYSKQNDSGEPEGVVLDILDLLQKESGLKFEYVPMPAGSAPLQFLQEGNADLMAGILYSDGNLSNPELHMTIPFFHGKLVALGRKGAVFSGDLPLTAAIPSGFSACEDFVRREYPLFKINFYTGTEDCLEAVRRGKADILFQSAYVLDEYLQGPRYESLAMIPNVETDEPLCIGGLSQTDPLIISILNKAISHLPEKNIGQFLISRTFAQPYRPTLSDFFIQYRIPIIITVIFFLLFLILIALVFWERKQRYLETKKNEQMLQNITNNISGGVVTITQKPELLIRYANDGFLELTGYPKKQGTLTQLQSLVCDPKELQPLLEVPWIEGHQISMELHIRHLDGHHVPVLMRGTMSHDEQGIPLLYCVIVDISEQQKFIQQLKAEKFQYHLLIEQSDSLLFDVNYLEDTAMCSPKLQKKFGLVSSTSMDLFNSQFYIYQEDIAVLDKIRQAVQENLPGITVEVRLKNGSGEYPWCRMSLRFTYQNGALIRLIGKIEDIDKDMQERILLENRSLHDKLTGLYNREAFQAKVESQLQQMQDRESAALFFLDLDNFKAINDKLGHGTGDQALIDAAKNLQSAFRGGDLTGRFGGDEFYAFALGLSEKAAVERGELICQTVQRAYASQDIQISLSASVGVAWMGNGEKHPYTELLQQADTALYQAKRMGKNKTVLYRDGMAL